MSETTGTALALCEPHLTTEPTDSLASEGVGICLGCMTLNPTGPGRYAPLATIFGFHADCGFYPGRPFKLPPMGPVEISTRSPGNTFRGNTFRGVAR